MDLGQIAKEEMESGPPPQESPAENSKLDLLRQFVELDVRRLSLQQEVNAIKKEQRAMEEVLIEFLLELDPEHPQMRIAGRTVHLVKNRDPKSIENKYEAVKVLEKLGWTEYVTYNSKSLGKVMREMEDDEDQRLPPELSGIIWLEERFSLRTRKS